MQKNESNIRRSRYEIKSPKKVSSLAGEEPITCGGLGLTEGHAKTRPTS